MSYTIWLTGLPSSGKTTIAKEMMTVFRARGTPIVLLDGDIVRSTLSKDLGYTKEERDKHITRIANVCHLINKSGVHCLVATVSPTYSVREYARSLSHRFVEVYVYCPLKVCKHRDVKGLYATNEKNFVGLDLEYEEPLSPEVTVDTGKQKISESVNQIIRYLENKGII